MWKAGLIVGGISVLLAVGLAIVSPLCVPCMSVLLGLVGGYLAGVFDKPIEGRETMKAGAYAGGIGGVGAILGQAFGAVVNATLVGPERAAQIMRQFGIYSGNQAGFESSYWLGVIGSTMCFSVLDILLMAGFGVLGALAWGRFTRAESDVEIPEDLS